MDSGRNLSPQEVLNLQLYATLQQDDPIRAEELTSEGADPNFAAAGTPVLS